jgi:RNA polymerase sigma-70 factor (ECF subfamily)
VTIQAASVEVGPAATRAVPQQQAEVRVWSVLTVDVVEGRIQAVRIVRNPDKLGHLGTRVVP